MHTIVIVHKLIYIKNNEWKIKSLKIYHLNRKVFFFFLLFLFRKHDKRKYLNVCNGNTQDNTHNYIFDRNIHIVYIYKHTCVFGIVYKITEKINTLMCVCVCISMRFVVYFSMLNI